MLLRRRPEMMRLLLALTAAAIATACQSATSTRAGSDLLLIGLKSTDDASTDCDAPRTMFQPTRAPGRAAVSLAGSRLTAVALVYRRSPPRRPHAVVGALSTSVARDAPCLTDLIHEIRDRAAAEGCDAVVVGDETTADGRTRLDGSCLVFAR